MARNMLGPASVVALFVAFAAAVALIACSASETAPEAPPTATVGSAAEARPTPLPLDEYLVMTLRLTAEADRLVEELVEGYPGGQGEAEEVRNWAVQVDAATAQSMTDASVSLAKVEPPPEAAAYHAALLGFFEEMAEAAEGLGSAIEEGDPQAMAEAIAGLDVARIISSAADVSIRRESLTITALRRKDEDRLSSYLISVLEIRRSFASSFAEVGPALGEMTEGRADKDEVVALYQVFIEMFEDQERQFQRLSPPPEAQEAHRLELAFLSDTVADSRQLLNAIEDEDAEAFFSAIEYEPDSARASGRLEVARTELLIEALSR